MVASALALVFALANGTASYIFLIVVAIKAVDLVADMYLAPVQSRGDVWILGAYQALNGLASVALYVGALALGASATAALAMSIVGSLVAALLAFGAAHRSGEESIRSSGLISSEKSSWWALAKIATPLGFAGFLNSVAVAAPRYFLERNDGLASVAVFSAMAYVVIVGNSVVGAVVQYELPRTQGVLEKEGSVQFAARIRRLTLAMTLLGLLVLLVAWVWGEMAMTLFYGPGYVDRTTFMLLMLGWTIGAISWIWDMALILLRRFRTQMMSAAAGCLVAIVASYLLTPEFGLVGGGIATLLAALATAVARGAGLLSALSAVRGRRG
ncbi:lipopolysaccharide biosynthesis protein [Microbacterium azadirachtae]|uniref:lipopolysaccharide biosynthesis protein n=1 Tax=Microbacterium azadirachtae TaxID=582680 RepID=UPI003F75460B